MPVNSTSPMSLPPSPAPPADTGSRKRIALAGAGLLALVMVFAFLAGGKKAPPRFTAAEVDDRIDDSNSGKVYNPDNLSEMEQWFNVPKEPVAPEPDGQPPAVPDVAASGPAVVTGDSTDVSPPPPAVTEPAGIIANAPASPAGTSGAVGTPGSVAANPETGPRPAPPAGAPAPTIAASQTASPPLPSSSPPQLSAVPAAVPPTGPVSGEQDSQQTASPAAQTPASHAPSREDPPAVTASLPSPSPSTSSPAAASARLPLPAPLGGNAKTPGAAPEFVPPATRRPGVVAQSRSLITQQQFADTAPSVAPGSTTFPTMPDTLPARVTKLAATAYAGHTTEKLREQGALSSTQRLRLPRQNETANARIWREEDTPAAADELRPFGVVIEDTNPATTAEGIPLRTDIPAGVSPLEKNGADKPLWKRPGM